MKEQPVTTKLLETVLFWGSVIPIKYPVFTLKIVLSSEHCPWQQNYLYIEVPYAPQQEHSTL